MDLPFLGVTIQVTKERLQRSWEIRRAVTSYLKELERKLGELALSDPKAYVVIDARRMAPFRWVFGALEACRKAKVRNVRFQAPPVEGQGGSDWWWM